MAAAEEVVLEIVPEQDILRLRAGQKIIALTALEDRALVKLSHVGRSYARRHKVRFVDVARNWAQSRPAAYCWHLQPQGAAINTKPTFRTS
jgi:hypothetical protein